MPDGPVRDTLVTGQRVRFADTGTRWWTVRAASPRFAVLVQQVPFKPRGTMRYTIIDWAQRIRGACNLVGQGYGDGTYSATECAQMLEDLEREWKPGPVDALCLEVSHRNRVPLRIAEVTYHANPEATP